MYPSHVALKRETKKHRNGSIPKGAHTNPPGVCPNTNIWARACNWWSFLELIEQVYIIIVTYRRKSPLYYMYQRVCVITRESRVIDHNTWQEPNAFFYKGVWTIKLSWVFWLRVNACLCVCVCVRVCVRKNSTRIHRVPYRS